LLLLHFSVYLYRANIPGSSVDEGDKLFNYLPLFPVQGTGYHRYAFVLYQHDKKMDFSMGGVSPDRYKHYSCVGIGLQCPIRWSLI